MVEVISGLVNRLGWKLLHSWIRFENNRDWHNWFQKIFQLHPEYRHSIDHDIEREHIELWRAFRKNVNLDTLRLCFNLSGKGCPDIVPEEIFAADIQKSLCQQQEKIRYLANKSFYNRWYSNDVFPKVFIHNIEGEFFNEHYDPINKNELQKILEDLLKYPVVIKPNMDSMGGINVYFPTNMEELEARMTGRVNYVIQEVIKPDEFFAKYNRYGLNTLRVILYRSVVTNNMNYLHACLRMGQGGGLDNETAGGIHCYVFENGQLNDYAVDKYGNKYKQHPDTKLKFSEDRNIPAFDEMKRLAIKISRDLYLARLISLDMCLDENGQWRVIEINLFDQAIRAAQYAGQPFFGPFTKEVADYCKRNPWWKQ